MSNKCFWINRLLIIVFLVFLLIGKSAKGITFPVAPEHDSKTLFMYIQRHGADTIIIVGGLLLY